jgi:hypothetical protein
LNASRSFNPLAKAAEKNGLTEAIKCLVEAGANTNVLDTMTLLNLLYQVSVQLDFIALIALSDTHLGN